MNVDAFRAAIGIALGFLLTQLCPVSATACGRAPRVIGAFGAENNPPASISLPEGIRSQLPKQAAIEQVLNTQLSSSGEQVIIFDTTTDESDPHPQVAFVVGGIVVKVLDELVGGRGGPVRYLAGCQFDAAKGRKAVALAFSTAFDGSGSSFDIIMWKSKDYQIVFSPHGFQGRLVLGRDRVTLWTGYDMGACVWCAHHYEVIRYRWHNGLYVETGINKLNKTYEPSAISGMPLRIANETEGD